MKKHYNEFDWERELRRDEQRISCYFCELAACFDLPNEEEFIVKRLQSRPELVSLTPLPPEVSGENFYDDNYELMLNSEWRRDKSDIFAQLEILARDWTLVIADKSFACPPDAGLNILCQIGKILTKNSELIEFESNKESLAFQRAVFKRLYAEINTLIGKLQQLNGRRRILKEKIKFMQEQLRHIREQIFDKIHNLK